MKIDVHFSNHTPLDWNAVIESIAADFYHKGGGVFKDQKSNVSLRSGTGEAVLYSDDFECITSFTAYMTVRDKRNIIHLVEQNFKDPLGRECVVPGQDVKLGKKPGSFAARLKLSEDHLLYELQTGA